MTVAELIAILQQQDPTAVVVLPLPTYDSDDTPTVFAVTDMRTEVRAVQLRITRNTQDAARRASNAQLRNR